MGFKFRKRVKIADGFYFNLSKKGFSSVSVGKPGSTYNFGGKNGPKYTVGLPGTGMSYSFQSNSRGGNPRKSSKRTSNTDYGLRFQTQDFQEYLELFENYTLEMSSDLEELYDVRKEDLLDLKIFGSEKMPIDLFRLKSSFISGAFNLGSSDGYFIGSGLFEKEGKLFLDFSAVDFSEKSLNSEVFDLILYFLLFSFVGTACFYFAFEVGFGFLGLISSVFGVLVFAMAFAVKLPTVANKKAAVAERFLNQKGPIRWSREKTCMIEKRDEETRALVLEGQALELSSLKKIVPLIAEFRPSCINDVMSYFVALDCENQLLCKLILPKMEGFVPANNINADGSRSKRARAEKVRNSEYITAGLNYATCVGLRILSSFPQLSRFKIQIFSTRTSRDTGQFLEECIAEASFDFDTLIKLKQSQNILQSYIRNGANIDLKLTDNYCATIEPSWEIEKLGDDRILFAKIASNDEDIEEDAA